jgi:hypothetical protein
MGSELEMQLVCHKVLSFMNIRRNSEVTNSQNRRINFIPFHVYFLICPEYSKQYCVSEIIGPEIMMHLHVSAPWNTEKFVLTTVCLLACMSVYVYICM